MSALYPLIGSWFSLPYLDILCLCCFLLCLWVLQGPSPSVCDSFESQVFPSRRSYPLGRVSYVSLCPFVFYYWLFCQAFVGCSLVFILISVSGIFSLPSSFCLASFLPLYWWLSFTSYFLHFFSFCLAFPDYLLPLPLLSFAILQFTRWGACNFLT